MTANIAGALSRPWMFLRRRQYLHNIPKQELERSGGFADDCTASGLLFLPIAHTHY
jgi:hypothetical protein